MTILVIEDDEDLRLVIVEILSQQHTVSEAADGDIGIYMALQSPPQLALVDIDLPGTDGYEVARQLRRTYSKMKLVAMTGHTVYPSTMKSAGFDAFLAKPFDVDVLFSKIEELAVAA